MKKILILASVSLLAACNSSDTAKPADASATTDTAATSSTMTTMDINSPYPVGYSSKFAMGDPKNAEAVLQLWKDWDNGTLSAHKDLFADSVSLNFSDGSSFHGSRDSAVAAAQNYRNSMSASISHVDAITALKSTDKNQNWALIWGGETDTDKKGKVDSFRLQETWRFNSNGKADLLYQFRASIKPAKK